MEIDLTQLPYRSAYKLLTGTVIPRPIAWVSTINEAGQPNLAPYSFFNAVSADPPILVFSPGIRSTDLKPKDTYNNIQSTGEFVVNLVTEDLGPAMNISAQELPPDINEFELAGMTTAPSVMVKPPRVAESPVNFECKLQEIVTLGDNPGGGFLVIGQIVMMHLRDDLLIGEDKINLDKYNPIGRLVGNLYSRIDDKFELIRPPSKIKMK
jgi:flavin reductase (DIM6/NTAB) family NADH-FMN oxidoreductase RutF